MRPKRPKRYRLYMVIKTFGKMLNGKPEHIELSKYVWDLKSRNIDYAIKWKLLKRAKPYNCASN